MGGGPEEAVPLLGGRLTSGVVRIGDTVRRPASSASAFTASLLGLLERRGFAGAPRYLGQDPQGRDVLSYMPGWVPARLGSWSDEQVAAAGRLARAMHDATRGSELAGTHPVVCHHDLGPTNMVFRDGDVPVAFIDFDQAAAGSVLEDLGYMAWLWCVRAKADAPPVHAQAAQVRVLADAYGLTGDERAVLVDAMLERQSRNVRFWAQVQAEGRVAVTAEQVAERIAWSRRAHDHTAEHRRVFEAALT